MAGPSTKSTPSVGDSSSSQKKKRTGGFRLFKKRNAKAVIPPPAAAAPASAPKAAVNVKAIANDTVKSTLTIVEKKLPNKTTSIDNERQSWLCRMKFFKSMIGSAFDLVDQDGSGSIDEKELYSGLLLIHLKLGVYAGPAACKPISREKCHNVFMKMDVDGSGHLDRDEFEAVMMVLFGNVMMRVAIQYACTLMVVPMIAQYVLNGILALIHYFYIFVATLDEHFSVANQIELTLEHLWSHAIQFWSRFVPTFVSTAFGTIQGWISAVPDSVWNTIPLTLLSTLLSIMLIPWSLLQIDDLFQRLADKSGKSTKTSTTKPTTMNTKI